ncbi:hypothetical protein E0F15_14070 [Frankia sp. B2]|nr:hypothetical protein E0F15_14070 [Frankia sp. B2]
MERELSDGTVEGIAINPETGEEHPFLRRPGRRTRAVVYPPFRSYGVEVRSGTRPIWLYLRLSKYHRDGADAIERHRIDLTRLLAGHVGRWKIAGGRPVDVGLPWCRRWSPSSSVTWGSSGTWDCCFERDL